MIQVVSPATLPEAADVLAARTEDTLAVALVPNVTQPAASALVATLLNAPSVIQATHWTELELHAERTVYQTNS